MIKKTIFAGFIFLFFTRIIYAQDTIPLIRSGDVITDALALHDDGKYDEAIAKYHTISESDTNYVYMLSELMFSYLASGQNEKALQTGEKAIKFDSRFKAHLLIGIGNALDNIGESNKAIATYQKAIKQFPYNHLLHFNLGITYFNQKKYKGAVSCFQKALKLQPFHAGSHLYLGKTMILQGSRTKAILCLETYLAIKPADNKTLVLLENLVNDAEPDEGSIEPVTDNSVFSKLDLIIKSKAALDERFKSIISLDVSITRQTELIFEMLPYNTKSRDFWVTYYMPFFKDLYDQQMIEPFIYTWLSSVKNEDIEDWNSKNKAKLNEFYSLANDLLTSWRSPGEITQPDGTKAERTFWYYDSKELNYIGNVDENKNTIGNWIAFYKNGQKKTDGYFNSENNKSGTWTDYYENGSVKSIDHFDNNGLTDTSLYYYKNRIIQSRIPYHNNLIHGTVQYYFNCGDIKEISPFSDGMHNGTTYTYYSNDRIASKMNYVNDTLEGLYFTYYTCGAIQESYHFRHGKTTGNYNQYYSTGALKETGNYVDDLKEGEWIGYYKDSTTEYSGAMKNNERSGTWTTYFKNGNVKEIMEYENGKLVGEYKTNDSDGLIHTIQIFELDTLKGQTFFNKKGGKLSAEYDPEGNFEIETFYPDGPHKYTAIYRNGMLDGEVTTYYHSGGKHIIQHFENGLRNGRFEEYHETGELENTITYKNGKENGYYRSFYKNGRINLEGWIQDGLKQQLWRQYDKAGNLVEENYYINDQLHGINTQYAPYNKPFMVSHYDFGDIIKTIQYDTTGSILNTIKYNIGKGKFVTLYSNKKAMMILDVQCGLIGDRYLTYYPDGNPKFINNGPDSTGMAIITAMYPSGKVRVTGEQINGESSGKWLWYGENGDLETEGSFENNLTTGRWVSYYENGQTRSEYFYMEDELSGPYSYFDSFGQLIYEKTYIKGNLMTYRYMKKDNTWSKSYELTDGTLKSYFSNGKVSAIEHYFNGHFDDDKKIYYSNGQLYKNIVYKHGNRQNESVTYFPSGQIKTKSTFRDDELHGLKLTYHKNGNIREEKTYYLGKLHGPTKKYSKDGTIIKEVFYWNDEQY